MRHHPLWAIAATLIACSAPPASAQRDRAAACDSGMPFGESGVRVESPRSARGWAAAGLLVLAAAAVDTRLRDYAAAHRHANLDRAADRVDPLGRAGVLVPALVASVALPRVFGARALSDHAMRVAISYAASDAVESILKPIVGRHRPSDGGGAWRFHPFRNDADWHSLPSAHAVHVFSIASSLADETRSGWIAGPAYAVASAVGVERVYVNAHWTSDVVASATLGVAMGSATDRWVREHGIAHLVPPVPPCPSRGEAADAETSARSR